MITKELQ